MTAVEARVLVCGTIPGDLLGLVADGAEVVAGSHPADCPYCQRALAEMRELWRPVRWWAGRDLLPPAGFAHRVLTQVARLLG